jgi:hypothetical protein
MAVVVCAVANAAEPVTVRVLIDDQANTPAPILVEGQRVAAKVFRHAGVDLHWVVPPVTGGPREGVPIGVGTAAFLKSLYVVRLAANASAQSRANAVGFSAPGTRIATVVYPRVEQLAKNDSRQLSQLLGHIMAHELGHLLLGHEIHSAAGVMRATLDIERALQGRLTFTAAEGRAIRNVLLQTGQSARME